MPIVKNISPLGDLEIPAVGRTVMAGEEFEVPVGLAESLLEQPSNFVAVAAPLAAVEPVAAVAVDVPPVTD